MNALYKSKICEGNCDETYLKLPNIRDGKLKDTSSKLYNYSGHLIPLLCTYTHALLILSVVGTNTVAALDEARTGSLSIYHVECDIFIASSEESSRCKSCKKYRKTLSTMLSRRLKDQKTHPSSHTTYANLSTSEKDERLRNVQQENKKANLCVARLKQKISDVTSQGGVVLDDEIHNDIKAMMDVTTNQVHSSYPEGSFQRIFWDQQQTACSLKNSRSMKWHPLIIKWSLYLRHLSGKAYEVLRKTGCIKLPSQRTLRDYTHYIPPTIGFSSQIDQELYDIAFLSNDLNRYVFLILDEVHIKTDLVYDKHQGSLIGFVNLGNTNNQLLEFENAVSGEQHEQELASSMLVLMVRGIFQKLNYPYAQFACNNLSGEMMFDPVWEAISRLERIGFRVLGITCDGASPNR